MPDDALVNLTTTTAPKDYTLSGTQELQLKAVRAAIDGSAAASSFMPCLQLLAPDGTVMFDCVSPTTIAAGGSADVSWFPRVGSGGVTSSTVLPINPAFSGNTIVPTACVVCVRSVQPAPATFGAGIEHDGFRTIITKTGILHDLSVYVGNGAGNIEVAILDTNTPTRTILYKTGYVAVPGSDQWFTVGDPGLSVTVGDQYDISVSLS